MSDIVLVEGNNELNVAMTPLAVGVAEFVYASDIRQQGYQRPGYPEWATGISFEIDIKNVGGSPGTCTPIAHIIDCYYDNSVGMGTQTINPGQTVTFSGNWYWPYGPREAGEWWGAGYIMSEAGPISFAFGRSLYFVSADIPAQVPSGGEFWATQVVHLPAGGNYRFEVALILPGAGAFGTAISGALVSANPYGGKQGLAYDILLTGAKDYTVRGIWLRDTDEGPSFPHPAKAICYDRWHTASPIPPGIYNVISSIRFWTIVDGITDRTFTWPNMVVGQVQIV